MAKVFVVNRGPHNYAQAERFGQLIFCTDGVMDRYDTAQMYRELEASMKESDPEDYILLTSLSTLCCIACAIFSAKHGELNLLLYSGDNYIARSLILDR